jgi:Transglutaminase-like superfamily
MSTLVSRYLHLPPRRKRLLHAALAWLILSRIGLALLPLPTLQRLLPKISRHDLRGTSLDALRWAVLAAARRLPGTRCLARAFALQALMARSGIRGQLCIGVAKESGAALEAHAWVLHAGEPVCDEPDLARYSVLSVFPAEA